MPVKKGARYIVLPTKKQRKAVDNMVENGGIVSRAMRDAGYSPATAQDSRKLTESRGFKAICLEHGLTEGLIITALVEDIEKKPQNRKPELELGAKILRMTDNENQPLVVPIQVNISQTLDKIYGDQSENA